MILEEAKMDNCSEVFFGSWIKQPETSTEGKKGGLFCALKDIYLDLLDSFKKAGDFSLK